MEKLFFENSNGNRLCGILASPSSSIGKLVVILCHGLTSNKDSKTYLLLEKLLNEKGIPTFRFDFFGHGESQGNFEDITISEAVDDILCAIKFLKNFGYSKIGLMGTSFGGAACIIAAPKEEEIFLLALKSPVSNYAEKEIASNTENEMKEWKEKGYKYRIMANGAKQKINYSFFEDAKKNNGYKAAEKISIPTMIVHGDKDERVSVEQSKKLAKIIKNSRLEIIKGADHHCSKQEHFDKAISIISDFIEKEVSSHAGDRNKNN